MVRLLQSAHRDSSGGFLNAVDRRRAQPAFSSLRWDLTVATPGASLLPRLNFSAGRVAVVALQLSRERLAGLEVRNPGHTAVFLWGRLL